MRKYQTGGIKKAKTKPVGSRKPPMEEAPYGKTRPVGFGKPRLQTGGKKSVKKKTVDVDDFGMPVSAAEARRRDRNLTQSIGEYGGYDYIRKQMGESPSSSTKPSFSSSRGAAADNTRVAMRKPITKKRMAKGGSLGMKSVKAGYDKNPGVTRADVIVAAKGKAKRGTAVKKAKVGASMTKMANMKKGGKCKYGC